MVQFFGTLPPKRSELQKEMLGESIGKGLSDFLNNYYANKALEGVESSKDYKNAPISEKTSKLERALTPFGQTGLDTLQRRIGIEERRYQEGLARQLFSGGAGLGNVPQQQSTPISQQVIQQSYAQPQQVSQTVPGVLPAIPGSQASQAGSLPSIPQQNQVQQPMSFAHGGGFSSTGGIGVNQMPVEEMAARAQQAAALVGDPNVAPTIFNYYQGINEARAAQAKIPVEQQALETKRQADILARDEQLRNFASKKLAGTGIFGTGYFASQPDSEDLNDFMRMGQKYSNLQNPADWFEATKRDYDKFANVKSNFENAFVPGVLTGIYRGGMQRENDLDKLIPLAKPLVAQGKEAYVRNKLSDLGLTRSEQEKVVNPLQPEIKSNIEKLPISFFEPEKMMEIATAETAMGLPRKKGFKSYEEVLGENPKIIDQMNKKLTSFMENNITPNTSLLALRDDLMNKKYYDWRQVWDSLQAAQDSGKIQLSSTQQAELSELGQPPRDSVANIFRGWGNIVDFLKGAR